MPKIITIDGPAGAGKTSIAKLLSRILPEKFEYLDTGMTYRAIARRALLAGDETGTGTDPFERTPAVLVPYLKNVGIKTGASGNQAVFIDGKEVPDELLRTGQVSDLSSRLSAHPEIRAAANGMLRKYAGGKNVVAEGRDTGSVLFPDASVKLYLYADLDVRASRRMAQDGAGFDTLPMYVRELLARDRRDSTRETDPLRIPQGAVYLDTSAMSEPSTARAVHDIVCGVLYPDMLRLI